MPELFAFRLYRCSQNQFLPWNAIVLLFQTHNPLQTVLQVKGHLFILYFIIQILSAHILLHTAAQLRRRSSSVYQGHRLFSPLSNPSVLRPPLCCYLWTHQGCCKAWSLSNLLAGSFCSKWSMKSFAEALVGRRKQRTQGSIPLNVSGMWRV